MPDITGEPLLQAAAEHPVMTAYVGGLTVALAVLAVIALRRPRVFASVVDEFALDNHIDRRLLAGAVVVTWSAGWPITLALLALRGVHVVRVAWRRR
jgi:hypothetical protein